MELKIGKVRAFHEKYGPVQGERKQSIRTMICISVTVITRYKDNSHKMLYA